MNRMKMLLLFAAFIMSAAAADVTGKWTGTRANPDGSTAGAVVILKQTGTQITGSAGPDDSSQYAFEKVKMEGASLTAEVRDPSGNPFTLTLTVDGDRMKGEVVRSR